VAASSRTSWQSHELETAPKLNFMVRGYAVAFSAVMLILGFLILNEGDLGGG